MLDGIKKELTNVDFSRLPEDQASLLMFIKAQVSFLSLRETVKARMLHSSAEEKKHIRGLFKDPGKYELSIELFKFLGVLDDDEKVMIRQKGVGRLLGGLQAIYENRNELLNPDKRHTIESLYEKFYKHFAIEGEGTLPRLQQRYKDARNEARDFLIRRLKAS